MKRRKVPGNNGIVINIFNVREIHRRLAHLFSPFVQKRRAPQNCSL